MVGFHSPPIVLWVSPITILYSRTPSTLGDGKILQLPIPPISTSGKSPHPGWPWQNEKWLRLVATGSPSHRSWLWHCAHGDSDGSWFSASDETRPALLATWPPSHMHWCWRCSWWRWGLQWQVTWSAKNVGQSPWVSNNVKSCNHCNLVFWPDCI